MNLGTTNNSSPGRYLVSYRPSSPGYSIGDNAYAGYVYMPTAYGVTILRIQVNNSTDAKSIAEGVQTQFTLETVKRDSHSQYSIPPLTRSLLTEGFSGNTTQKLLQLTARLAPFNPPEVKKDVPWVSSTLELAGLSGGTYTQPAGVDLAAAVVTATEMVRAVQANSTNYDDLGNRWFRLAAGISGDFKSHYLVRVWIAAQGYLQLTADQAVYPMYAETSSLLANQTYRVTFFGKPDVTGFWSLTAYGEDLFLVPNELNRYSLGDRSAITYQDGSLVYGGTEGSGNISEPFVIILQTTDVIPPANYCSK